jgi:diguanylate cyclase (GGDEF)-like protein
VPRSMSRLRRASHLYSPTASTTNLRKWCSTKMSESQEFSKGIERLIDQMIAGLPEEMQSAVRKQLADQREVAWIARAEAIKAQEEQKCQEEDSKRVADSTEKELIKTLASTLFREQEQRREIDPKEVQEHIDLLLKINEKYTEFEVAKARCPKSTPSDDIARDYLTGVFNTRYLNKALIEEIARSDDHDTPLTMLMLDIDAFKRVNDTFGHLVGDDVLKSVAGILRSCVRSSDFVFRFGGDEFIVLLPGIGLDRGLHIANNIRDRIGTSSFGLVCKITVTIAACEHETGEAPERFLARADQAMYRAKRGGDDDMIRCGCL